VAAAHRGAEINSAARKNRKRRLLLPSILDKMTHEEKVACWLHPLRGKRGEERDFGVEVGAFKTPVPGIRPFYVDRFAEYAHERVLADYFGDLCGLPFRDDSLDYVVASHVIEHVANPVKALWECARVVRHGGMVYLVVPDRRFTFDHTRALTPPEHMIADFDRGTRDSDPTHIADFLDGLDWSRWNPNATPEANAALREQLRVTYTAATAAGSDINIHFHTFEQESFTRLIALMNPHPRRPCRFEIVDRAECFPQSRGDGFLFVLRVHKPLARRIAGLLFRLRAGADARQALQPGARDFSREEGSASNRSADTSLRGCIDLPAAGSACDPQGFRVEGWIAAGTTPATQAKIEAVEVWCAGVCAGRTATFFSRPDVNQVLSLAPEITPGWRIAARLDHAPAGPARLELRVIRSDGAPINVAVAEIRFTTLS
jgi:SAM-dependent methyltransferase